MNRNMNIARRMLMIFFGMKWIYKFFRRSLITFSLLHKHAAIAITILTLFHCNFYTDIALIRIWRRREVTLSAAMSSCLSS